MSKGRRWDRNIKGTRAHAELAELEMQTAIKRAELDGDESWPPGTDTVIPEVPSRRKHGPTLREAMMRCRSTVWTDPDGKPWHAQIRNRAEHIVSFFENLGKPGLEDIGVDEIAALKLHMRDHGFVDGRGKMRPLQAVTQGLYLSTLSILYREARKKPTMTRYKPDLERPKASYKRDRALSPEEEAKALAFFEIKGWTDSALAMRLALGTAMRRCELLNLKTTDFFNLDDPELAYVNVPGTKTTASAAAIPLAGDALIAARDLVASAHPGGKVFPKLPVATLERRWAAMRDHLGLAGDRKFTFHLTRHTVATRLFDAGVDANRIREFMRHENIATTMLYNAHNARRLDDVRKVIAGGNSGDKEVNGTGRVPAKAELVH
jgi:integrase